MSENKNTPIPKMPEPGFTPVVVEGPAVPVADGEYAEVAGDEMTDEQLLEKLLSADDVQYRDVFIARFGTYFRVRSISSERYNQMQKRCTYFEKNKRTKQLDKKVDQDKLGTLLIAEACVRPNFNDKRLLDKYNTLDAADVVNKRLLIGEIGILSEAIMEASGFDMGVDDVKN